MMKIKAVSIIAFTLLYSMCIQAQTITADMDTTTGVQNIHTTKDTAQIVTIALRVSGADAMFSYQFKVTFDTARFSFIAAQQDFGVSGEKNVLKNNGGSVIGICQMQANPAAPDTIEFSFSITGTDAAKSVNGGGLVGVLYLKSKIVPGDSSSIAIVQGYSASLGGDLIPMTSYKGGTYKILPKVGIGHRRFADKRYSADSFGKIAFGIRNAYVTFAIPEVLLNNNTEFTLRVFSLNGKLVAAHHLPVRNSKLEQFFLQKTGGTFYRQAGTYLYSLEIGDARFIQTITIP